jgi:hypothetical protein
MAAISTAHQRTLRTARENLLRQQDRDLIQSEVARAKWVQQQTGCTWTEALRASYALAAQA